MLGDLEAWHAFLQTACFARRLPPSKFAQLVRAFQAQHGPIAGEALLEPFKSDADDDPRVPGYLKELLQAGLLSVNDVLQCFLPLQQSTAIEDAPVSEPATQTLLFQMLSAEVSQGSYSEDLGRTIVLLIGWIEAFPSSTTVATFVGVVLSQPKIVELLQPHTQLDPSASLSKKPTNSDSVKLVKTRLGQGLAAMIAHINSQNMELASNLLYCQNALGLNSMHDPLEGPEADMGMDALAFQESVTDALAPLNTRAGLFVFLNGLLCPRPVFEDAMVINILNARYKNNIPSLVTDLIVASFDVLANAMYRSEPAESMAILRSFLVNKLPVFLLNYSGMLFESFNIERCIAQALGRLDPTAFPSVSQIGDLLGSSGTLSEAKQEFLFACALHNLLPESKIEGLLGDVPMQSLPAGGRYARENLVGQCMSNSARIEELIVELDNLEGNAAELAAAIIQVIQTLCSTNDTMTLKGSCNALSRRPQSLDILSLFVPPKVLLSPLINVLNSWQMQDDQGENQPVYDEFGSILLLVITVFHCFQLDVHEYMQETSSFTARYLRSAHVGQPIKHLDEQQSKSLGAWVRGLFETEGISDELMSLSSPQAFHLGIATLFDQSFQACQTRILSLQTVRGGFDFLLEPFLLPSLVAGLKWFGHKLWEISGTASELDAMIPLLEHLLIPPSISSDARSLHSAVLSMAAKTVEEALNFALQQHPTRTDILPLVNVLRAHKSRSRRDTAAYTELEGLSSTSGGLQSAFELRIYHLSQWDISTADLSATQYTHTTTLNILQILGSQAVLDALTKVIVHAQSQSNNNVGDEVDVNVNIILDIATMIVLAPVPSRSAFPSLLECLRSEASQAYEVSKTDMLRAMTLIRLHRRVEAFKFAQYTLSTAAGEQTVDMNGPERIPAPNIDDVLAQADQTIGASNIMDLDPDGLMVS